MDVVDYPAVLNNAGVPTHVVGGWWTRGYTVSGSVVDYHPVGIFLSQTDQDASTPETAEQAALSPEFNAVIGADGAWWVVAAGASHCGNKGYERVYERVVQGQPPDDLVSEETVDPTGKFFSISLLGAVHSEAQVTSLCVGCFALQRAHHWKGHRVIGAREWSHLEWAPLGLDLDGIRRQIRGMS